MLPEWTAATIGVKRVRVTRTLADETSESLGHRVGSFGTTVNSVCRECNGGWMSDLESLATRIIKPMIHASREIWLDSDEQLIVASWLWKTAVVHEYNTGEVYFTDEERTCLTTAGSPPDADVFVWLALVDGDLDAYIRGGPCSFSDNTGSRVSAYMMSLHIKHFGAQLLCFRRPPDLSVSLESRLNFNQAQLRVWPESPRAVRWPPVAPLHGGDFHRWHERFNTSSLPSRLDRPPENRSADEGAR